MFFLFQVVAAQKAAPAANLASQKAPPAQAAVDKQAENARNRQAQKGCGHDPNGGICEACQKKAEFMERMKREKAGESKQSSPEEYAEAKKESANQPEQAQTGCGHDPNGGICEACQKKAEFMERMKQEKMKSVEVLAEQALPARETAPAPETAADFRQAEKTVFSESAPQLRQADLQSATQVSQAVALNTAFELTTAEEEARKRGKNRESRQPENAAEQNRAEAGAREENAAPVRETTGSGGGKAEAGGKERWQKAESGCEKAAAGGENAYKQRAAVAEEKGIGTLQQRGQGETGGSQKGANGAKKQYVIGEYTYEDILATAWLRKMYGHLIGLAESEETSAGETVREAGGKSARKEKPQSREVLGKKDEQRGKETEKPSGKKTGAEAQEKEKPKAAAKETRDAKANAHLKESANEKARRKGEIEKAKTGAKLEGKEKAGIKEQEGAKRSPAERKLRKTGRRSLQRQKRSRKPRQRKPGMRKQPERGRQRQR